ncbi:alpha/beta fold hydrolase [Pseudoroseomonas wenyumeiae]
MTMPVLGLGATYTGMKWLPIMSRQTTNFRLVEVKNSGHFIAMEQPVFVADQIRSFMQE